MSSLKKMFKRTGRSKSAASIEQPQAHEGPVASLDTPSIEHPQGLEIVHDDPEASLDIVAVHGLNGHREKTWTAANGVYWLRDLLPNVLPGVRVLSWGYDANTHSSDRVSCQYLYDHALELVSDLTRKRNLTQSVERPIIFIAHSLGGLVVKSALIHSDAARQDALNEHRSMRISTHGIIYMGTPHQGGSGVRLGRVLVNIASIFIAANDRILKHLERDSEWLQQQLSQYNPISNQFVTKFAYETYETPTLLGHKILVVPKASAVVPGQANAEPIAINSDHIEMVKFSGNKDSGYIKVSETLQIMAKDAKRVIQSRWETEAQINKVIQQGDIFKLTLSPDVSQASQRYSYIPFAKNKRFTGRDDILDAVKKRLFTQEDCRTLAVVGLGGVGKTQVALQLAYWVKGNQPDYSVFWVPALSDDSFDQAYTEMAKLLSVRIEDDEDLKDCVRRHLESERAGKWLLIIDNADDREIVLGPADNPGGIEKYLPESDNGLTVFTTRSRKVAVEVAGSDIVDLHEMNAKEATEFLEKSLINKQLLQNKVTIEELFHELTYLPLAIAQAAAYLNQNQISIQKYLLLLQKTEQDLVSLMSREFHDKTRYRGSQNAVATTWIVSFNQIRRSDSNAVELLSFLSCIEPKAVPQSILPKLLVEEEMEHAISVLCGYAFLVRRGKEEDVFDMHRLVHIAARVWVRKENRIREIGTKAIKHLAFAFPFNSRENLSLCKEYLPHAQHALRVSQDYQDKERSELLHRVGRCLDANRRFKEAIVVLEEIYQWRRRYFAEEDDSRLASEYTLASAYLDNQQIREAIEILEHVVAIKKRTCNEEDNNLLVYEHELARAYVINRQTKKAIEILKHVVAVQKKTLNGNSHNRLASEQMLANAYSKNRQIKEAIEILEHVVAIHQKTLNEKDHTRLASEQALASAYVDNRQIKKGLEILEHVVAIQQITLDEKDDSRLASEHTLGKAYFENQQIKEALEIFKHIVAIRNKTLNEENYNRIASEHMLARAYFDNRQIKEAIEIFEHNIAVQKKCLTKKNIFD
ncbi:TPR-like protein [Xylariaceae sp. FL1651]|nr:TPR-like protein [Xylariaceae sp. FL1651]